MIVCSGFPGDIAGASLKRRGRGSVSAIRGARFPGDIAGASLKLAAPAAFASTARNRLPGDIAGASLKRRLDRERVAALAQSPR